MSKRRLKFRSPVLQPPLEAHIHLQIAAWLNSVVRDPWTWTSFPAGGGGRVRGAQLKRAGLKPGVPDILLFSRAGDWAGMEVKRPKLGRTSPEQDAFIEWAAGRVAVVRSVDDCEAFLRARGVLR